MQKFMALAKEIIDKELPDTNWQNLAPIISSSDIETQVTNCNNVSLENLGNIYLDSLGRTKAKKNGSYFTPKELANSMISVLLRQVDPGDTYMDLTCGAGIFLTALAGNNIQVEKIFGIDKDPIAIELARINLFAKYYKSVENIDYLINIINTHIIQANSLLHIGRYSYIIGNPPWGYQYSPEDKEIFSHMFNCADNKKSFDSFEIFLEKAINTSIKGTYLVLPESLLTVKAHQKIREIILDKSNIERIEILGDKFSGVMCPCISMLLNKSRNSMRNIRVKNEKAEEYLAEKSVISPKAFNVYIKPEENLFIKSVDAISADSDTIYLNKSNCTFYMGIVTGNNSKFLSSVKEHYNQEIILTGKNIDKYFVNDKTLKYIDYSEPRKYQQVAPLEFYRAKEKLLYRFIHKELIFAYDNKQTLHLNSCNGIILNTDKIDIRYLLAVLNSNIVNRYYRLKFHSVKVLASYLMEIPIILPNTDIQKRIVLFVDEVLNGYNEDAAIKINNLVSSLYEKVRLG